MSTIYTPLPQTSLQQPIVPTVDLDFNFVALPTTGDVAILKDANAVNMAITNLVLTNYFERFFHSDIGGSVRGYLFELFNVAIGNSLASSITQMLTYYETRATNYNVTVQQTPDKKSLVISVQYTLKSNQLSYLVTIPVQRTL